MLAATSAYADTPKERYQATYERVDRNNAGPYKDGVAGRNLADDGLQNGKAASPKQLRKGITVMRAMLHPYVAPVAPAPEPVAYTAAPAPVTSGGACDAIPTYIAQCESGCNYGAQNPSGAYGAYQIMPSTSSAYGCDMSSAEGQDACAAEIYAEQGASPWVCG